MVELKKTGKSGTVFVIVFILLIGVSGIFYYEHYTSNNTILDLQKRSTALQSELSNLHDQMDDLQHDYDVLMNNYDTILKKDRQLTEDYGWSGYIETATEVVPLLNRLDADGWNTVRYQAVPEWAIAKHVGYYSTLNLTVLDLLVNEAAKRNMTVYLLCAHCWSGNDYNSATGGSGNFIDGHEQEWINLWLDLGNRYKNNNVVIDAWSEYSSANNDTRYIPLAQSLIDALRGAGIETQIHFTIWWNGHIFALNDPLNNYSIGRHLYGAKYDNYNPSYNSTTTLNFTAICQESGIDADMAHYFTESNNMFYQKAKQLGVKFVISEMGASNTYNTSYGSKYSMSVGNVAYVMKLLQVAQQYNVTCIIHRIGVLDDYNLYYYYAMKYFGQSFWDPS